MPRPGDPHYRSAIALAGVAVAILLVLVLPSQTVTSSPATTLALLAAILLLDFFDLSLPQGDRIGLEGALVAASLLYLPPLVVLITGVAARAVAQMVARRRRRLGSALVDLSTTALGIAAASVATRLVLSGSGGSVARPYVAVGLACAFLLVVELLYAQVMSAMRMSRPFRGLLLGNLRLQGPLLLAEMSTAVLLVMTFERMGVWAFVLAVVLLLLLRHSYALLIDVRRAYMSTIEVLVETAESADLRREGHSERTATIARDIAEEIGLGSVQIERLSYAALLHDIDLVSAGSGHSARAAD